MIVVAARALGVELSIPAAVAVTGGKEEPWDGLPRRHSPVYICSGRGPNSVPGRLVSAAGGVTAVRRPTLAAGSHGPGVHRRILVEGHGMAGVDGKSHQPAPAICRPASWSAGQSYSPLKAGRVCPAAGGRQVRRSISGSRNNDGGGQDAGLRGAGLHRCNRRLRRFTVNRSESLVGRTGAAGGR